MTRHPTARRVHRPDAGPDDAFVANVLETSVWAREHARTLIIAVVAVVVVAVAAIAIVVQRRSSFEGASRDLVPLRALIQNGQSEQAIPQLEAYLQKHGGAKPAAEARLLLAGQYLAAGQAQKALDAVEPIGDPVAVNAAFLRAAAYEGLEEPHRAEEIFLAIGADAPFNFQKYDALDGAARLRLDRNDAAGAVELYQRLLDLTPATEAVRQVWEMRLAEARAAAAAAPAAAAGSAR